MWLQSWGWYVLSMWWFGCAHRLVGGIFRWGVSQRSVGGPFARILGETAGYAFLQFSLPSFLSSPPPIPSLRSLVRERNRSLQLQHAWPGRPLLTTFTLHSSARMFVPVCCYPRHCCLSCHLPRSATSSKIQSTYQ